MKTVKIVTKNYSKEIIMKKNIVLAGLLCGLSLFSLKASDAGAGGGAEVDHRGLALEVRAAILKPNFTRLADTKFDDLLQEYFSPMVQQRFDVDCDCMGDAPSPYYSFRYWLNNLITVTEMKHSADSRKAYEENTKDWAIQKNRPVYIARLKRVQGLLPQKRPSSQPAVQSGPQMTQDNNSQEQSNGGNRLSQLLRNRMVWVVGGVCAAIIGWVLWKNKYRKAITEGGEDKKAPLVK